MATPDPAVGGSVRTIPGCNKAPAHPSVLSLDELLKWPADQLAKLTCADLERALPGAQAPTLSAFESKLGDDQRNVYSTKIISPDVKLSPKGGLVDNFLAGVDQIGSNIGDALGLGSLLTGVLGVVLAGVFVIGGLAIVALGLNRLSGGGLSRAATTGAAVAAA